MDADILEYYDRGGEDTRLVDSIELLRTKVLLRRFLPANASVLDVGGASGVLPMLRDDLATGIRRGTQNVPYGFTTCYFHRPEEITGEIADAGLMLVDLLPVEGMAQWVPDIAERLSDPDRRAVLLELLERTEREPATLGATSHLLAVARKTA